MNDTNSATFGGGCFWCIEAAFDTLEGVTDVTSGYAGGDTEDPTYREVCSGRTGHAEVVQVEFDPETLDYVDLLEVFVTIHDPTQVDRQGPDVGSQYRSIILYHDETQRETAERYLARLAAADAYDDPIATEVTALETFYEAEEEHQDYFAKHPENAYCRIHAAPKVEKVQTAFNAAAESPPHS